MNKNENALKSLTLYCEEHPELRFWQALRNWASLTIDHKINNIYVGNADDPNDIMDTFYWTEKTPAPFSNANDHE